MLRNIISKKAPILIIQIFATISLLIGQFPLTVWADSTKATRSEVPVLLASPPKKQQAIFHDGLINSPRAQDPKYKITTNLGAFKKSPNLQAVTINLQAQGLIKAQTQWHFKISDYAVNFDQKKLQLPAGITARKMGTGHLILTVHKDLRISKQRGVEISLPVKAVTGNYPLYFAIEYGHSPVRLKTTSLGVLSLGGTLAHFKPQHQTQQLAHALKKDQNQEKQTITRKNARKAKPIQVHHSMAAKDSAKKLINNQQTLASMKSVTKTPELRKHPHENNINDSIFNSNITQRALEPRAEINNSNEGIKIHAENTQTHTLVTKLNDDVISTQDVTPEFAAYYDKDGTDIPVSNPEATVRVDEKGNGTLAVKKTGWYILHQTNNYPASSGWTYLIRNIDGTYTHGEDGNYYAVYYDANKNEITQSMSGGARQLLPVYATDVTALFNKQDTVSSEWDKALNYINNNGGEVTFYGNGDLTKQLPNISNGTYSYYAPVAKGTNGYYWGSSIPENQRYKYGAWLIDALQGTSCLQHSLPKDIDTNKAPIALSTERQSIQKIDSNPITSYDTTLQINNNLVTLGDRKIQRVNIDTQDRIDSSSSIKESQYNVFYAGLNGFGNDGAFGVKLLNQADTVNPLTSKLYLSNFNQDGWYILQQKDLAGNGTDYQINGSYYALRYSVLDGITEYFRVSQKFGDQIPLPPILNDVTALFNKQDTVSSEWDKALNYINNNGGEVTFYGNGDLTKQLPNISNGTYSYYAPVAKGTNGYYWGSSIPENQRYKYGAWLIDALQGTSCLQHPLPKDIDTMKIPLPLSTIGKNGAEDTALTTDHKSGTTQDGVITYTNDYSNNNEQNLVFRNNAAKITKIAAGSSKNLAGAKFRVWYSGSQGNGDPLPADKVVLDMVNNTPKLETDPTDIHEGSLFNYNLEGWYIIQESQAPQGYGLNGNYYAVYLDGSGFTKLMQYSSNEASKGPVAALPSNYTAGVNTTDSLIDCSYIDGDADAIAKWNQGVSTKDGFITIKAGKIIFADRFNGINKIDADLPDKTLSGATFKIWDSGANGSGVFNTDHNLKLLGSTTATNKNGQTLFSAIQNRGWYIIQEETSPEGYNLNELYYAIYYDPANGIIGLMKHASRQLLPVYATDVTALFNKQDTTSFEWDKALNYINNNGGEVTFYGNGDLTKQLPNISNGTYSYYAPVAKGTNGYYWGSSIPENQRYKYGAWLIDALQGTGCLQHPLPQDIDTTRTSLDLSTKTQEYLDLAPETDAYTQGLTTADGFLTGKNGDLNFRDKFIGIQKVDQDDNQKTLKGATFKVFYSGLDGKDDPKSKLYPSEPTNDKGITKMPVAGDGWYIIQEQTPPEGYIQNTSYYALKIDSTYGIIAMMTGSWGGEDPKPVYDNSGNSNYGTEKKLAHGTDAYNTPCLTIDGFLIAQYGHLVFQDKFTGLAKVDYFDENTPVSDAEFYLWYAGLDGGGFDDNDKQLPVVDKHGLLPGDKDYDASQNTFKTKESGLLQLNMKKEGWYILEEGQPPAGYKDHSGFYYAFYWSPGVGVSQVLKGDERQLLPPMVNDVKALFDKQDTTSSEWDKALNYINNNGGEVTFYGNGDLTKQLPNISNGTYSYYAPVAKGTNGYYWGSSIPENQRYKYGAWLIDALQGTSCLHHSLPKDIDTTKTPLALSTVNQNLVKLPYADKNDYNSPYRKGVTSNDGFLTAKNGSLYIRNIPATYLTLDNNNPLVVKLSDLQKGKIVWKGLWHDLNCLPTNDKTAYVTMSVDGQDSSQITKPSKAAKTGTDEYGQKDFQVTFKDDDSKPDALNESQGQAGLKTNDDSSLGKHTLAFQAHGTANSRIIKKKIIVISDDYPYETKINKYFTVNSNPYPYKRAVLSDFKSGIGDKVTVYTEIKNIGNNLYNGKLTTIIPEQFAYIQPDDNLISLKAEDGSTISVQSKYDGRTLTINLPDLKKSDQYKLSYTMEQIAPMPLSYPGPSGGASAMDHLNADSHDEQNPFYGANSNLVQWFSDQISWVKLVHVPPLEFGEHLLIKNYVGMYLNNMATTKEPNENYFQLHDTGYLGSNTWQLTAQLSNWSKDDSKKSNQNLPESKIIYQDDSSNFSKTMISGGAPIILLERSGGKLPSADIIQNLNKVQLYVGSKNPQAGRYHSTVTYTLTQSLE